MNATKPQEQQATASSREDRERYLLDWTMKNPMATIEQARAALREHFGGIAMGTKAIADALRETKKLVEAQYRTQQGLPPAAAPEPTKPPVSGVQERISRWAKEMRESGVRLIALQDDGSVRVEFVAA